MSKRHVLSDMGDVCLTSQHHVNDRWRSPITLRLLVGSCGEDDFFFGAGDMGQVVVISQSRTICTAVAISFYMHLLLVQPASSGGGHRFTSRFLMESVQKVGTQCHALHIWDEIIHTYQFTTHMNLNSRYTLHVCCSSILIL